MDPLPIVLVMIDEMNDGKQMKQLANGWMGWESKTMRRVRALSARMLVALAARLAPAPVAQPEPRRAATTGLSA